MEDLTLESESAQVTRVTQLLDRYKTNLVKATEQTVAALQQARQQLAILEKNQLALNAQKALIDRLEADLSTENLPSNSTNAHTN